MIMPETVGVRFGKVLSVAELYSLGSSSADAVDAFLGCDGAAQLNFEQFASLAGPPVSHFPGPSTGW